MIEQNIKIAADAMIFYKGEDGPELLLIKRGRDPHKGMWALPGGFVEDDEELEAAAIRELEEETGMKIPALTQLHAFGKVNRDPRGRNISITHYAIVKEKDNTIKGADDAAEAAWVKVSDITALAFDHMEVLVFALKQLRDELGA